MVDTFEYVAYFGAERLKHCMNACYFGDILHVALDEVLSITILVCLQFVSNLIDILIPHAEAKQNHDLQQSVCFDKRCQQGTSN